MVMLELREAEVNGKKYTYYCAPHIAENIRDELETQFHGRVEYTISRTGMVFTVRERDTGIDAEMKVIVSFEIVELLMVNGMPFMLAKESITQVSCRNSRENAKPPLLDRMYNIVNGELPASPHLLGKYLQ